MHFYERLNQRKEEYKRTRIGKRRIFGLLIVLFIFYPILTSEHDSYSSPSPQIFSINRPDGISDALDPDPSGLSPEGLLPADRFNTIEGCVRSGQSFYTVLLDHGFPSSAIANFVEAFKPIFNCRKISPGDEYQIVADPEGSLITLTIKTSSETIYHLKSEGENLIASKEKVSLTRKVVTISGDIDCSLFSAVNAAGEGDRLAIKFADIFAWDIDFRHDLQKGDRFKIIVEKHYLDDTFIRYGKILAAEYKGHEKIHQAIYFQDPEGVEDYYTPEGNSIRRSFLRSPLRFTRISSGYSYRRFHPILKRFRPHLGVDFAAPSGTPVWAVADGVVARKGWKNGNGNRVTIRHPLGYETMYNHLSSYGKGIKVGKRVKQKEIIGYVGSTGLSTGSHLDYRMAKNGKFINPLTEKFPPGFPVQQAYRDVFFAVSQQMLASLAKESFPPHTTVARFQLLK